MAASFEVFGPVEATLWVCFPEIQTTAEPVVIVLAGKEGLAFKQIFGNRPVTTVVAENKGGCKGVHWLSVDCCELAVSCDDASSNQECPRSFRGANVLFVHLRQSNEDGFKLLVTHISSPSAWYRPHFMTVSTNPSIVLMLMLGLRTLWAGLAAVSTSCALCG